MPTSPVVTPPHSSPVYRDVTQNSSLIFPHQWLSGAFRIKSKDPHHAALVTMCCSPLHRDTSAFWGGLRRTPPSQTLPLAYVFPQPHTPFLHSQVLTAPDRFTLRKRSLLMSSHKRSKLPHTLTSNTLPFCTPV